MRLVAGRKLQAGRFDLQEALRGKEIAHRSEGAGAGKQPRAAVRMAVGRPKRRGGTRVRNRQLASNLVCDARIDFIRVKAEARAAASSTIAPTERKSEPEEFP
jgi:hypothetical protein